MISHRPQRNTPERAAMLARRAMIQRARTPGFTPSYRRPRGHVGKWNPFGEKRAA